MEDAVRKLQMKKKKMASVLGSALSAEGDADFAIDKLESFVPNFTAELEFLAKQSDSKFTLAEKKLRGVEPDIDGFLRNCTLGGEIADAWNRVCSLEEESVPRYEAYNRVRCFARWYLLGGSTEALQGFFDWQKTKNAELFNRFWLYYAMLSEYCFERGDAVEGAKSWNWAIRLNASIALQFKIFVCLRFRQYETAAAYFTDLTKKMTAEDGKCWFALAGIFCGLVSQGKVKKERVNYAFRSCEEKYRLESDVFGNGLRAKTQWFLERSAQKALEKGKRYAVLSKISQQADAFEKNIADFSVAEALLGYLDSPIEDGIDQTVEKIKIWGEDVIAHCDEEERSYKRKSIFYTRQIYREYENGGELPLGVEIVRVRECIAEHLFDENSKEAKTALYLAARQVWQQYAEFVKKTRSSALHFATVLIGGEYYTVGRDEDSGKTEAKIVQSVKLGHKITKDRLWQGLILAAAAAALATGICATMPTLPFVFGGLLLAGLGGCILRAVKLLQRRKKKTEENLTLYKNARNEFLHYLGEAESWSELSDRILQTLCDLGV